MFETNRDIMWFDEQPTALPCFSAKVESDNDARSGDALDTDASAHPPQKHNRIELVRSRIAEGPACRPFSQVVDDPLEIAAGRGQTIFNLLTARSGAPLHHTCSLESP